MRSPMIGSKGKRVNGLKLLANQMAIYCNPRTQGHSFPSHSMHSFLLHLSSFHSLFLSFFSLFLPTFLPIFLLDLHAVMATGAVSLSLSLSDLHLRRGNPAATEQRTRFPCGTEREGEHVPSRDPCDVCSPTTVGVRRKSRSTLQHPLMHFG